MSEPPARFGHNKPAPPDVTEEAVIFAEGGTPRILTVAEVLASARAELDNRPNHLSLAAPYWFKLQQAVLALDTAKATPAAKELAEIARLVIRIQATRGTITP